MFLFVVVGCGGGVVGGGLCGWVLCLGVGVVVVVWLVVGVGGWVGVVVLWVLVVCVGLLGVGVVCGLGGVLVWWCGWGGLVLG
ncbi:hypothetical protein, partial [Acinetobacter baumannii]